jgi:hypothetical protein
VNKNLMLSKLLVQVSFQGQISLTSLSDGPHPIWNEKMIFKVNTKEDVKILSSSLSPSQNIQSTLSSSLQLTSSLSGTSKLKGDGLGSTQVSDLNSLTNIPFPTLSNTQIGGGKEEDIYPTTLDATSISQLDARLRFDVFDVLTIPSQRDSRITDVVALRADKRWLGSAEIPISSIYSSNCYVEGSFPLTLEPFSTLAYEQQPEVNIALEVFFFHFSFYLILFYQASKNDQRIIWRCY